MRKIINNIFNHTGYSLFLIILLIGVISYGYWNKCKKNKEVIIKMKPMIINNAKSIRVHRVEYNGPLVIDSPSNVRIYYYTGDINVLNEF